MISRRLLRIKVLMELYAFNRREDNDPDKAEKELMFSIEKAYDLYHYIFLLIIELSDIANEKIELALQKKMPTPEDLNPNRRFALNKITALLRENLALKKHLASTKLSWSVDPDLPRSMYNKLIAWEPYQEYMKAPVSNFNDDRKFISRLINEFFSQSEDLASSFEEQSIYWNDDLEYMLAMASKTIKKFKAHSTASEELMPLYKDKDDAVYVKKLFRKAMLGSAASKELIDRNTTNWEIERVALMDTLVMQLAITEIVEFPEIPVKVTLNEYIEIAKYYCTSKSSTFVNGILDKVVREMRENNLFSKSGRGLVGEIND